MNNNLQTRDKKGRFTAQNNNDYVPVPSAWLKRLLEVSRRVESLNDNVNHLKGYCESAEGFIIKS